MEASGTVLPVIVPASLGDIADSRTAPGRFDAGTGAAMAAEAVSGDTEPASTGTTAGPAGAPVADDDLTSAALWPAGLTAASDAGASAAVGEVGWRRSASARVRFKARPVLATWSDATVVS